MNEIQVVLTTVMRRHFLKREDCLNLKTVDFNKTRVRTQRWQPFSSTTIDRLVHLQKFLDLLHGNSVQ